MTLQFVTGTSSTDHQTTLIQMAREWLLKPNREVFFLVPNYNKFEVKKFVFRIYKMTRNIKIFILWFLILSCSKKSVTQEIKSNTFPNSKEEIQKEREQLLTTDKNWALVQ